MRLLGISPCTKAIACTEKSVQHAMVRKSPTTTREYEPMGGRGRAHAAPTRSKASDPAASTIGDDESPSLPANASATIPPASPPSASAPSASPRSWAESPSTCVMTTGAPMTTNELSTRLNAVASRIMRKMVGRPSRRKRKAATRSSITVRRIPALRGRGTNGTRTATVTRTADAAKRVPDAATTGPIPNMPNRSPPSTGPPGSKACSLD